MAVDSSLNRGRGRAATDDGLVYGMVVVGCCFRYYRATAKLVSGCGVGHDHFRKFLQRVGMGLETLNTAWDSGLILIDQCIAVQLCSAFLWKR